MYINVLRSHNWNKNNQSWLRNLWFSVEKSSPRPIHPPLPPLFLTLYVTALSTCLKKWICTAVSKLEVYGHWPGRCIYQVGSENELCVTWSRDKERAAGVSQPPFLLTPQPKTWVFRSNYNLSYFVQLFRAAEGYMQLTYKQTLMCEIGVVLKKVLSIFVLTEGWASA